MWVALRVISDPPFGLFTGVIVRMMTDGLKFRTERVVASRLKGKKPVAGFYPPPAKVVAIDRCLCLMTTI